MVVFLIFARSAKVLATYRGKVINRGNASPCKEGNALARGWESEGQGFDPSAGKENI